MERDGAEDDVLFEEEANPLDWVAESFAAALGDVLAVPLTLDLGIASIRAEPGIASTMEYDPDELMMGAHDYTFWIRERPVEFSLQLYENISGYYRLFGYFKKGMAFSVNLTLGCEGGHIIYLGQQLTITSQGSKDPDLARLDRQRRRADLVAILRELGFDIGERNWVDLGAYDPEAGAFLGTTGEKFLRDFLTISVLKGHFMQNKGYSLTGALHKQAPR